MPRRARRTPNDLALVFHDAHRHGTAALQAGDLKGFGEAIDVERSIIEEQRDALVEQGARLQRQRAVITGAAPPIQPKRKRRRSPAHSR